MYTGHNLAITFTRRNLKATREATATIMTRHVTVSLDKDMNPDRCEVVLEAEAFDAMFPNVVKDKPAEPIEKRCSECEAVMMPIERDLCFECWEAAGGSSNDLKPGPPGESLFVETERSGKCSDCKGYHPLCGDLCAACFDLPF